MTDDTARDDTAREREIALVTGASRGIGREVASQLATLGMTVLVAARDSGHGQEAVRAMRSAGLDAHPIALDVTDEASIRAAAREVGERFGRLDVLVNNAGISGSLDGQATGGCDLATVREVFETNVLGAIAVTEAMLPHLRQAPHARIVNVSSEVGSLAAMADSDGPMSRVPAGVAYPPSKSALNSLTVQYAKGLRDTGILVNAVTPGACATDFTAHLPFRITRTAAQGAEIAVRLASLGPDGPTGGFWDDDGPVAW